MTQPTQFGSISAFQTGGIQPIDDDPKNYVFSNVFAVSAKAAPYERVAVGKNLEYVIEAVRAEGTSPWYAAAHDEFALAMDGDVTVELVKLAANADIGSGAGARLLTTEPQGKKMGWVRLRRGHMALLPVGAAYRFNALTPSCLVIQSIDGPLTVHRWAQICSTQALS